VVFSLVWSMGHGATTIFLLKRYFTMRYVFLFLFLICKFSSAQTFTYPKFPKQGKDITNLIPKDWKVIDTAYGDLNNDATHDLAFVLEYGLPIAERRAYGDNETELIKEFQKPRMLVIYLKNKQSDTYTFCVQNNNFILRANEGGSLGDPLKKIEITNQNLQLSFEGGHRWRWKLNYEFKLRDKEWTLVKANTLYYNNESGEMTEKNYNFVDRKVFQIIGNIFSAEKNIGTEEILYFSNLRTFNTFKKPWTWQVTKDNFL